MNLMRSSRAASYRGIITAGILCTLVPSVGRASDIDWAASFESAMEQARAEDKFVMVDFYTSWCHWCRVLDQKTYSDPRVSDLAKRMISVKVNAEAQPAVARQYRVSAYPTVVFIHPDGEARKVLRGFKPPEGFLPLMEQVLDTSGDRVYLESKLVADSADRATREQYAATLALGGEYLRAAAQIDTLMTQTEGDDARDGLALDALVYRFLAQDPVDSLRGDLQAWINGAKGHPRRAEAKFYMGQIEEKRGFPDDAKKLYSEASAKDAPTWVQERAAARIDALTTG